MGGRPASEGIDINLTGRLSDLLLDGRESHLLRLHLEVEGLVLVHPGILQSMFLFIL